MTTVRLDNGATTQMDKYYIEIYASKINEVINKSLITYEEPVARPKWNLGSTVYSADFLTIRRKFMIAGLITPDSNWSAAFGASSPVANALIVKERIFSMIDKGGVLKLTVGTVADGYDQTRTYYVHLLRTSFTEIPQDIDVAPNYDVEFEFEISEDIRT